MGRIYFILVVNSVVSLRSVNFNLETDILVLAASHPRTIVAHLSQYTTFSYALKPKATPFAGAAPALGMLAGLIGSALSYLFLFIQLVFSRVALNLKRKIDAFGPSKFSLGRILLPVIGGAMSGAIGWICPLTIGSGLEPLIFLSEEVREERSIVQYMSRLLPQLLFPGQHHTFRASDSYCHKPSQNCEPRAVPLHGHDGRHHLPSLLRRRLNGDGNISIHRLGPPHAYGIPECVNTRIAYPRPDRSLGDGDRHVQWRRR